MKVKEFINEYLYHGDTIQLKGTEVRFYHDLETDECRFFAYKEGGDLYFVDFVNFGAIVGRSGNRLVRVVDGYESPHNANTTKILNKIYEVMSAYLATQGPEDFIVDTYSDSLQDDIGFGCEKYSLGPFELEIWDGTMIGNGASPEINLRFRSSAFQKKNGNWSKS